MISLFKKFLQRNSILFYCRKNGLEMQGRLNSEIHLLRNKVLSEYKI